MLRKLHQGWRQRKICKYICECNMLDYLLFLCINANCITSIILSKIEIVVSLSVGRLIGILFLQIKMNCKFIYVSIGSSSFMNARMYSGYQLIVASQELTYMCFS